MHRTILKLYASILIYCYNKINLIQFSLSFQSPPTFSFPIVKSQRGYFSDDVTSDTESSKDSSILFNENIILGETLDINLNDGTYSWSNPKAKRMIFDHPSISNRPLKSLDINELNSMDVVRYYFITIHIALLNQNTMVPVVIFSIRQVVLASHCGQQHMLYQLI